MRVESRIVVLRQLGCPESDNGERVEDYAVSNRELFCETIRGMLS